MRALCDRQPEQPSSAAVVAPQLTADDTILAAPFGDQALQVQYVPAVTRWAECRELVIVLVQGAESVEDDQSMSGNCETNLGGSGRPALIRSIIVLATDFSVPSWR